MVNIMNAITTSFAVAHNKQEQRELLSLFWETLSAKKDTRSWQCRLWRHAWLFIRLGEHREDEITDTSVNK